MSPEIEAPQEDFGEVVASLRVWIFGLGSLVLAGLLLSGASRGVLAGFLVGGGLALFTLDHFVQSARQIGTGQLSGQEAKALAVRTYVRRMGIMALVLVVSVRFGADPVAAISSLLLLQAAVMCRSIGNLIFPRGDSKSRSSEDESAAKADSRPQTEE